MRKRTVVKKSKIHNPSKKSLREDSRLKTIAFYFRAYFLSLVVGISVFTLSTVFFKTQPACANSGSCLSDLKLQINNSAIGMFEGHVVTPPKIDIAMEILKPSVLGADVPNGTKHIYVDLSTQTLYAYQGDTLIMQTPISSGRWDPTPVGNFHIWEKLLATRMAGGQGPDAYDLPNVPFVMYFYNDFGLHGAYWHNNFGHTMSHGCVNMRIVDAQALYNWADGPSGDTLGTAVSTCNHFSAPNTCIQDSPINTN